MRDREPGSRPPRYAAPYGKAQRQKFGRVTIRRSARRCLRRKSHKVLVINAVYPELRTRVLTAIFALLILRPPKSPSNRKVVRRFTATDTIRRRDFLHQRPSSQPKMGVIPAKQNPDFMIAGKWRNGGSNRFSMVASSLTQTRRTYYSDQNFGQIQPSLHPLHFGRLHCCMIFFSVSDKSN